MDHMNPTRRSFLYATTAVVAGAAGAGVFTKIADAMEGETIVGKPGKVTIQRFTDLGKSIGMRASTRS